jgi:K+-sensing histidine kinase KdpD
MKRAAVGKGSEDRKATVVCVTDQFQCERIIRAGRSIANLSDTSLLVVSVLPIDATSQSGEAIEHLFKVSQENDAEMSVFYSDKVLKTLMAFIKKKRAVNVVTGMPRQGNSVLSKMWEKLGGVSFFTVDENGEFVNVTQFKRGNEIA